MKKLICALLAAMLAIAAIPAAADGDEIIFTEINNDFLPLSVQTMPIKHGGKIYVPYTVFREFFGAHVSYNSAEKLLIMFDWDYTLTFDLKNGKSTAQNGRTLENPPAEHNGTVYVAAEETAAEMGLYCSVINAGENTAVRINSAEPALDDAAFIKYAAQAMQTMAEEYNRQDDGTSKQPEQKSSAGTVYITFFGGPNKYYNDILDVLDKHRIKAAFFVQGQNIPGNARILNRIIAEGHSIGICGVDSDWDDVYPSAEKILAQLDEANRILDRTAKIKTRIVQLPRGCVSRYAESIKTALENGGYRAWDWSISLVNSSSSNYIADRTAAFLSERNASRTVIRLGANRAAAAATEKILDYIEAGGIVTAAVKEYTKPLNFIGVQ